MKQYYQDVSDGLLTYTNIVTAYIRMTQPKSYYNDTSKDCGEQGILLIKDAIAILEDRGLRVRVTGTGMVRRQSLQPGSRFLSGSPITLELAI